MEAAAAKDAASGAESRMTFRPMATAPRSPTTDVPSTVSRGFLRFGPDLALLAVYDDGNAVTLIRGCWRQAGDEPGCWWDYDNGDAISLTPIGWTAMPTKDEMLVLLEAATGG